MFIFVIIWSFDQPHWAIGCFMKNKNLLIEEYPLSARDLTYEDGHWCLRTNVKSLAGVGRFYLGLSDQISIVDSPELTEYVKRHIRKNLSEYV